MEVFRSVLSTSLSVSWLILLVLAVRWLLRKAPRRFSVLLWGLVAVRLLCPVMMESPTSLLPPQNTGEAIVSGWMEDYTEKVQIYHDNTDAYQQAVESGRVPIPAEEGGSYVVTGPDSVSEPATVKDTILPLLTAVWVCGMAALALYTIVSYLRLRSRIGMAVRLRENIYQSDAIQSPFVMGLVRPRIYLPFGQQEEDVPYVIAHEQAHLDCGDHLWKPLGLMLLTIHWFNPLMWVAYILLCRDIEMACDERVIRTMKSEQRAAYSQALVSCSLRSHKAVTACPLAFGEIGVKERVRAILHYRKPTFWILTAALAAVLAIVACFLTRPLVSREFPMSSKHISDLDTEQILTKIREIEHLPQDTPLYVKLSTSRTLFDAQLDWGQDGIVGFCYPVHREGMRAAELRIDPNEDKYFITESTEWEQSEDLYPLKTYLDALKYLPLAEIRALSPDADWYAVEGPEMPFPEVTNRELYYNHTGVCLEKDAWIHLQILPLYVSENGGYQGNPSDVIHVQYTGSDAFPSEDIVRPKTDLPLLDATEAQLQAAQTLYESWWCNELIPAEDIAVGNMDIHSSKTVYIGGKAYRPVRDARYTALSDIQQALHRGFTDQGLCALGLDTAEKCYREQDGTLYWLAAEMPPILQNWEGPVLGIVEQTDTRLTLRFPVSTYANKNQILPGTTAIDLIFVQQNGSWKLDGQAFYTGALPSGQTPTETTAPLDREELLAQALTKDDPADYAKKLVTTQLNLAADYPVFSTDNGLPQLTLPLPQGWSVQRADEPIQSGNILEHYIPDSLDNAYDLYDAQGTRRGMISLADNQTEETAEFMCYYGNNLHFGDDNPHVQGNYPENVTVHTAVVEHWTNNNGIAFQDGIWMQHGSVLLMMEVDLNQLSDEMLAEIAETLADSLTNRDPSAT